MQTPGGLLVQGDGFVLEGTGDGDDFFGFFVYLGTGFLIKEEGG